MQAPAARRRLAGFTLVELVVVMLIVAALAVFVVPRLLDLTAWQLRAFGDELVVQTRAMQRLALQQRRTVVASFTSSGVSFAYSTGGSLGTLDCPAGTSPCLAGSVPASVSFNASSSGAALTSSGGTLNFSVGSRNFALDNDSGLLRALN